MTLHILSKCMEFYGIFDRCQLQFSVTFTSIYHKYYHSVYQRIITLLFKVWRRFCEDLLMQLVLIYV